MSTVARRASKTPARVWAFDAGERHARRDTLATEEPLEIRLTSGTERRTVAVTMRTPGADFELAAGFLFNEGVIAGRAAIRQMAYCVDEGAVQQYNIVAVALRASALPDLVPLERHFVTTSACGVCGKASLDSVRQSGYPPLPAGPHVAPETLHALPDRLRAAQGLFTTTGGLHAAGLFDARGNLLAVREDVGRHNALDKLIGWAVLEDRMPLSGCLVLVSGRASFELVQKCAAAGVPFLCAVSAPSSLAVDLAADCGMTLVGFLRADRFNVYSGVERVCATPQDAR